MGDHWTTDEPPCLFRQPHLFAAAERQASPTAEWWSRTCPECLSERRTVIRGRGLSPGQVYYRVGLAHCGHGVPALSCPSVVYADGDLIGVCSLAAGD